MTRVICGSGATKKMGMGWCWEGGRAGGVRASFWFGKIIPERGESLSLEGKRGGERKEILS
jgi:hypothetical protein